MNQSTIIFGFLFAAFLIFITQRGELPTYWGFLVKSPQAPSSGPTASTSGSVSGSSQTSSNSPTAADYASYAKTAADVAMVFA